MSLTSFSEADLSALRWRRSESDRHEYELLSGDQTIAMLHWKSLVGSFATATTTQDVWTLKRSGFLDPHITLRANGEAKDLARLTVHSSRHAIEMAGKRPYHLVRSGLLLPAWDLRAEDGARLINLEPIREKGRLIGGVVTVDASARQLPELALLLVLAWYFIVLAWLEDEAARAGAAFLAATS